MANCDGAILRRLQSADIPAAYRLSADAGWNQTEDDWRLLMDLAPEGCLGIEVDGCLVATTTQICYGRKLSWIGMVLTHRQYRRQGLASKLLASCLEQAEQLQVETIKLDATDQGQGLYETFGFHAEQEVQRWSRPGDDSGILPIKKNSTRSLGALWIRQYSEQIVLGFWNDWGGGAHPSPPHDHICSTGQAA